MQIKKQRFAKVNDMFLYKLITAEGKHTLTCPHNVAIVFLYLNQYTLNQI